MFNLLIKKETTLLQDALKEIKEWWQVFKEDKDYQFSDDVYGLEIINYLKEDGFPEDIIKKAMTLYSLKN
jgi:hypothetical protein